MTDSAYGSSSIDPPSKSPFSEITHLKIFDKTISDATRNRQRDVVQRLVASSPLGPPSPLFKYLKKKKCRGYKTIVVKEAVLGRDEESAQLHILVLCSPVASKRIKKFFHKRREWEDLCRAVGASREDFLIAIDDEHEPINYKAADHIHISIALAKTGRDCGDLGMTAIRVEQAGRVQFATMGGFIIVKENDNRSSIYGMTANHFLPRPYSNEEDSTDPSDTYASHSSSSSTSSYDDDDDDDDDAEPDLGSANGVLDNTNIVRAVTRRATVDASHAYRNADTATQRNPMHSGLKWSISGRVSRASHSSQARDRDWALVEDFRGYDHDTLQGALEELDMIYSDTKIEDEFSLETVKVNCRPSIVGSMSSSPAYVLLPGAGKFVRTYTLMPKDQQVMSMGSSGSWVVAKDEYPPVDDISRQCPNDICDSTQISPSRNKTEMRLVGQAIADDAWGNVYVVPMVDVMDDIKFVLKAEEVRLPRDGSEVFDLLLKKYEQRTEVHELPEHSVAQQTVTMETIPKFDSKAAIFHPPTPPQIEPSIGLSSPASTLAEPSAPPPTEPPASPPASPPATGQQPTLEEFKQRLYQEWTREVACQNQCQPPESCTCLRQIIHVDALIKWFRRTLSAVNGTTNLHQLLQELQIGPHRKFPLEHDTYFTGKYQCLRVFGFLLKKDLGHLIDRFYQSQLSDIGLHHDGNYGRLRENLTNVIPSNDIETLIQQFCREKWSFCPLELELHIDRPLEGTKVIAPFCHKILLGRGGTASVYLVTVQKDLIRDERLKAVLQDSVYHDSAFGDCYKMAMKTYVGNKKSVFEAEKDAFSALKSNIDVPIVRYLGSFTHDYGEGITSDDYHMRQTYNLLLEYGEFDLYQYWADHTNIPPVRVDEIVRYWEKLFEIAIAIRKVHYLDVSQWKTSPLKYHGWHADIKPNNILLVNGRFKLADFGYSAFTPVAKTKSGTVPTDYINGFTDSYGAPEVSRMKRPKGTTSEVTQSIDTWSFGCVLSVAATWVVLGFQGVRQYETLRRLSPGNKNTHDRFHDGFDVLPEVKKWHNYLRDHLRQSDTMTSLVLDLIEHKMLQTETNDRIGMKELCTQLEKLIKDAKEGATDLTTHTIATDSLVLKALLTLEWEAQARSSMPKTNPLHRRSKGADVSVMPNSSEQEWGPVPQDGALRSTPLGQTTFRKEILEGELKERSFLQGHDDEITDSQVDAHAPELPPVGYQRSNHLLLSNGNKYLHDHLDTRLPTLPNFEPRYPSWSWASLAQTSPYGRNHTSSNTFNTSPRDVVPTSNTTESSTSSIIQTNILGRTPPEPVTVHRPVQGSKHRVPKRSPEGFEKSPRITTANIPIITHAKDTPNETASQFSGAGAKDYTRLRENIGQLSLIPSSHASSVPHIKPPTPRSSHPLPTAPQSDVDPFSPTSPLNPASPSITVTLHPVSSASTMSKPVRSFSSHDTGKQVAVPEKTRSIHCDELPRYVYDLPYDICRVRKEIDNDTTKSMKSHLKGMFRGEERKANFSLKKTYASDRDIVLVVDNGWTMCKHWPIVTFVAETLAKHAAGLDKNGIDLMFTVDGATLNIPKIKGESGRRLLQGALRKAWPEDAKRDATMVDIAKILTAIYKKWSSKGKDPPATTLLILTDGDWSKTDHGALNDIILDFAKREPQDVGPRHFSIQLIRFGEQNKEKLTWLDDQLCKQYGRKDIVDHCSWRSTVEKMFRGSIETWYAQMEPDEPDITYPYDHLVAFFESFNDGGAPLLSPDSQNQSRLSLSRTSSRSSVQKKHESAPSGRMNSNFRALRKTYSVQDVDKEYR